MGKQFFCVGNGHLDPMWLWRWQEGKNIIAKMKNIILRIFICRIYRHAKVVFFLQMRKKKSKK